MGLLASTHKANTRSSLPISEIPPIQSEGCPLPNIVSILALSKFHFAIQVSRATMGQKWRQRGNSNNTSWKHKKDFGRCTEQEESFQFLQNHTKANVGWWVDYGRQEKRFEIKMRINYLNHLASRPQYKLNGSHQLPPNLQNYFDSPISNFTTPWMWSVVVKLHKRICPSAKRNIEPLSTNCNNSPLKSIQPLWNYYRRTRADPRYGHDGGGGRHFCGNNLGSLKLVTKAVYIVIIK